MKKVQGHSIFSGNKCKYFQTTTFSGDLETPSCFLFDLMGKFIGSNPTDSKYKGQDISEMAALLSKFRFDKHLINHKLSMVEAHILCQFPDAETARFTNGLVSAYHKRAFHVTEVRVSVKTHKLFDVSMSLALNEKRLMFTTQHFPVSWRSFSMSSSVLLP